MPCWRGVCRFSFAFYGFTFIDQFFTYKSVGALDYLSLFLGLRDNIAGTLKGQVGRFLKVGIPRVGIYEQHSSFLIGSFSTSAFSASVV